MSTPDEQWRSLEFASLLLHDLADGTAKRVPRAVRASALRVLRHYPGLLTRQRWYTAVERAETTRQIVNATTTDQP